MRGILLLFGCPLRNALHIFHLLTFCFSPSTPQQILQPLCTRWGGGAPPFIQPRARPGVGGPGGIGTFSHCGARGSSVSYRGGADSSSSLPTSSSSAWSSCHAFTRRRRPPDVRPPPHPNPQGSHGRALARPCAVHRPNDLMSNRNVTLPPHNWRSACRFKGTFSLFKGKSKIDSKQLFPYINQD